MCFGGPGDWRAKGESIIFCVACSFLKLPSCTGTEHELYCMQMPWFLDKQGQPARERVTAQKLYWEQLVGCLTHPACIFSANEQAFWQQAFSGSLPGLEFSTQHVNGHLGCWSAENKEPKFNLEMSWYPGTQARCSGQEITIPEVSKEVLSWSTYFSCKDHSRTGFPDWGNGLSTQRAIDRWACQTRQRRQYGVKSCKWKKKLLPGSRLLKKLKLSWWPTLAWAEQSWRTLKLMR